MELRHPQFIKGVLASLLFLGGCTKSPEKKHLEEAKQKIENNDVSGALDSFEKLVKGYPKSPEALEGARKAVKVAANQTAESRRLSEFLRAIVLLSRDSEELLAAQKQLAEVFFEKLSDYQSAVVELNRLLEFPHNSKETFQIRFMLSKSFYFLGKFEQAVVEIDEAISKAQDPEDRFQGELLKANIFTAQKKVDKAIPILSGIIANYPELAARDNVGITLSIAYEEKGDFDQAIQTLEKLMERESRKEFLQLRIDKLKERHAQMPGASGLRK